MTADQLSAILAERVMHWRVTPNRFLTGDRGWLPRWRFQPLKKLTDALRLLEAFGPQEYSITADGKSGYLVTIRMGRRRSCGRDTSKPVAICRAVAAALDIDVGL